MQVDYSYVHQISEVPDMHRRRWLAVPLAVPVAFAAFSLFLPAAQASVGVGVQAAPVRLGGVARAGGTYALPPVYVLDTGTQDESISVRVERLDGEAGRDVPSSWVRDTGPALRLSPHQSARVPLELVVPGGAKPGRYLSHIVVSGAAVTSVGRANLGVAAATALEFSVATGAPPAPFLPSWTWWLLGSLMALGLIVAGIHRSGLRVDIERNPPAVAPAEARPGEARTWLTRWRGRTRVALALAAAVGLAACATGSGSQPAGTPGKGQSIAISLKVVPTVVAVTASPSSAAFGGCTGGNTSVNTASTGNALGFPNGRCWLGTPGSHGRFPITITNTGVAAKIFVSGASAAPSDHGTGWGLCNLGPNPASACTASGGKVPGTDQYLLQNFAGGSMNPAGLTGTMTCDTEFAAGSCSAVQGDSQQEGIALTGPTETADQSTAWTVTVTWTAFSLVPPS
jgi:hypothetical protein